MRLTFTWSGWACVTLRRNYFINPQFKNRYRGTDHALSRYRFQIGCGGFQIHGWAGWAALPSAGERHA